MIRNFTAGQNSNVYRNLIGDGYWFEQDGVTTVIPNGEHCMVIIQSKER